MSDDLKQRLLHIGCFANGDAPCTCVTGILALNRIEELEAKLATAVEAAFREGFLAGTSEGFVNNPRIQQEWQRSIARAFTLTQLKGDKDE